MPFVRRLALLALLGAAACAPAPEPEAAKGPAAPPVATSVLPTVARVEVEARPGTQPPLERAPRGWPIGAREDEPVALELYLQPTDPVTLQLIGQIGALLDRGTLRGRQYWVAPADSLARALSDTRQLHCLSREVSQPTSPSAPGLRWRMAGVRVERWPQLRAQLEQDRLTQGLVSVCSDGTDGSLDQVVDNRARAVTRAGDEARDHSVLVLLPTPTGEPGETWRLGGGATTLPPAAWARLQRGAGAFPRALPAAGSAPTGIPPSTTALPRRDP